MKPVCRKCLLSQTDKTAVWEEIRGLINVVPEERRVSEKVYSMRLAACADCPELADGVCAKCGCYAELRAVYRRMYCPDEEDRWENFTDKSDRR
ncbi:MAG: DUF6171 family protein [Prevotella sp.]|nr:DUF6171 family protein [Prevotella sp.]